MRLQEVDLKKKCDTTKAWRNNKQTRTRTNAKNQRRRKLHLGGVSQLRVQIKNTLEREGRDSENTNVKE